MRQNLPGHCVFGCTSYEIYAGAHDRTDTGEPVQVIAVDGLDGFQFQHPQYQPVLNILSFYDIALIPLPEPIELNGPFQAK